MPYIGIDRKRALDNGGRVENQGELNYRLTEVCRQYLEAKGLKYAFLNDIVGALECAKQEFYRRVTVPYEDQKIKENGDVY